MAVPHWAKVISLKTENFSIQWGFEELHITENNPNTLPIIAALVIHFEHLHPAFIPALQRAAIP